MVEVVAPRARVDEAAIARSASAQGGNVTVAQLRDAGLGPGGASARAREGRLHRKHRGVYVVGHEAKPRWADQSAATLAAGDGAVVCSRSGLELWGALAPRPGRPVDVLYTSPRANRPGITVHRTRRLDPRDVTRRFDLPVTTPERSLLDAAEQVDLRELEVALNRLLADGLTSPAAIYDAPRALARAPRGKTVEAPPGARRRLHPQQRGATAAHARCSGPICRAPVYNARIGPYQVDAWFRGHGIAIEIDGYGPHGTPAAFDGDRERENDLKLRYGVTLIRFSYRTLRDRPGHVVAETATAVATSSRGTTRA